MMQKKAMFARRENPVEETKGEAFSDGNIEVKLCEQPEGGKISQMTSCPVQF